MSRPGCWKVGARMRLSGAIQMAMPRLMAWLNLAGIMTILKMF